MNVVLKELNLRVDRLNLSQQEAEIPFVALKEKIRMNLGGGESAWLIQPGMSRFMAGVLRLER